MRVFQIVLASLCIGLLVTVVLIVNRPKPAAPGLAYLVRPEIGAALDSAVHLADARNYDRALKLVDDANAFSNKTNPEIQEIDQVRNFVVDRRQHP